MVAAIIGAIVAIGLAIGQGAYSASEADKARKESEGIATMNRQDQLRRNKESNRQAKVMNQQNADILKLNERKVSDTKREQDKQMAEAQKMNRGQSVLGISSKFGISGAAQKLNNTLASANQWGF